jgi:hypothetical protein
MDRLCGLPDNWDVVPAASNKLQLHTFQSVDHRNDKGPCRHLIPLLDCTSTVEQPDEDTTHGRLVYSSSDPVRPSPARTSVASDVPSSDAQAATKI